MWAGYHRPLLTRWVRAHVDISVFLLIVYAALGELHATLDNSESAWQYFNDASESAMEAGKPKLANKYMEKASMYE